ncbi:hypothetical protein H0H81_004661 [Sphagnurus paluster]|uniref:Uncharacterized protein n=1 Tax=Sphagnurus paluster TaxID=117069 RepID=A0A9P7K280_9AGAR|nr:hypothetical protein H0H81_004661 [Sphagnurus paluster]
MAHAVPIHGLMTQLTSFSLAYKVPAGTEISDELLGSCADLFGHNYGIWGEKAGDVSKYTKPAMSLLTFRQRVKMTRERLREQCVCVPEKTVLIICYTDTQIVGHAFASVWELQGGVVGWITQLVVDISKSVIRQFSITELFYWLKDQI